MRPRRAAAPAARLADLGEASCRGGSKGRKGVHRSAVRLADCDSIPFPVDGSGMPFSGYRLIYEGSGWPIGFGSRWALDTFGLSCEPPASRRYAAAISNLRPNQRWNCVHIDSDIVSSRELLGPPHLVRILAGRLVIRNYRLVSVRKRRLRAGMDKTDCRLTRRVSEALIE